MNDCPAVKHFSMISASNIDQSDDDSDFFSAEEASSEDENQPSVNYSATTKPHVRGITLLSASVGHVHAMRQLLHRELYQAVQRRHQGAEAAQQVAADEEAAGLLQRACCNAVKRLSVQASSALSEAAAAAENAESASKELDQRWAAGVQQKEEGRNLKQATEAVVEAKTELMTAPIVKEVPAAVHEVADAAVEMVNPVPKTTPQAIKRTDARASPPISFQLSSDESRDSLDLSVLARSRQLSNEPICSMKRDATHVRGAVTNGAATGVAANSASAIYAEAADRSISTCSAVSGIVEAADCSAVSGAVE
eukprot:CAMPEP_0119323968 /NCGR_PEP_ID=MMETSP1333-20130426/62064_1 /TAXON_ID=418940 /ORGANISM="Scyphosphaera apsteinii, Strain RCC1455" /LENGTH=308 /DNA_ID=CAMNT_0007331555 /DNA_START=120 /DNA_END=1043 /DNA_ORIENTATION=+